MPTPQLSIILSTYNRREILLKTLESYQRQTVDAAAVELLVIDDGSTDGTGAAVAELAPRSAITIRYFSQRNQGLGAGRNTGLREATGNIVFFTDDDIVPAPSLLAEHLAWHRKFPEETMSMLGKVVWAPELHPTPFMEWLGNCGPLFEFAPLVADQQVSFEHFYTCNVSAKREFILRNGGFNETFGGSGYEDAEFSYRLTNNGMKIFYNPAALGYHNKSMSYAEACRRQETVFASWSRFEPTEAGQYLQRRIAEAKPPTMGRRLLLGGARFLGPLLSPLTLLFDTQVKLPRIVYSVIYNFHVAPRAKARLERRQAPN